MGRLEGNAMREKSLRDLTLPLSECPHMPYWGTVKEAIVQLNVAHEAGNDVVLVFDEAYRLVGLLSQRNILEGLYNNRRKSRKKDLFLSWETLVLGETDEHLSRPVKDFMDKVKGVVDVSDSVLTAVRIMLKKGGSLLPVTEGDKTIGIVRLNDLFHQISNAILRL
jgi:CBS-domain-containing membrane protein